MQCFKPASPSQSVGDCTPLFHEGVFHLPTMGTVWA